MVRGGAAAVGLKIAYVLAQFGVGVLLARSLGAAGFGAYAFVMAIVQVLAIVGQWGIPALLVRRVAIDLQERRLEDLKSSLLGGFALVAGTSLCAGFVFAAAAPLFANGPRWASVQVIVLVAAAALGGVLGGALRGFGTVAPSLLADETLRPWLLLAGLVVVLAVGGTMDAATALTAHAVAAVLALAISMALLARAAPRRIWSHPARLRIRSFAAAGVPFLFLAASHTLGYQTGTIVLGILAPDAAVGLYRTAAQMAEAVGIALFAVSTVIAPHLARAEADETRLRALLIDAHRIGVALVLPALLIVLAWGAWILRFVFGAEYVTATGAMHILVIGKLFYATTGFVGLALSMIGRAWSAAVMSALAILANVMLGLLLIPRFGIEGAAIADASSNFLVAALGALYLRRRLAGHGVTAFATKPRQPSTD